MTTASQGPSFCEYFRSFYYENRNTYLPPVDLSDETLRTQGDIVDDSEIPEVFHEEAVQDIFAVPAWVAMMDGTRKENCEFLKKHDFSFDKHDQGNCYCKCTYQDIPIMASSKPIVGSSDRGDLVYAVNALLNIAMRKRIEQVANNAGIKVSVPRDRLIPLKKYENAPNAIKKYCILMGPLSRQTREETISAIKHMTQQEQISLAQNLCYLIQTVGIADIDIDVFRLTADCEIALNSAAAGLFVSQQSVVSRGASVEKCARIGLSFLVDDIREAFGTTTQEGGDFRHHIESVYEIAMRPQLSKWKIALSVISLGLVPLICIIISLIQVRAIQHIVQEYDQLKKDRIQNKSVFAPIQGVNQGHRHAALMDSMSSMTEDVPFSGSGLLL